MPVPFDDDFAEYPDSPNKAVALPRPAPPANVISATVAPLLIAYNVCFSVALSHYFFTSEFQDTATKNASDIVPSDPALNKSAYF